MKQKYLLTVALLGALVFAGDASAQQAVDQNPSDQTPLDQTNADQTNADQANPDQATDQPPHKYQTIEEIEARPDPQSQAAQPETTVQPETPLQPVTQPEAKTNFTTGAAPAASTDTAGDTKNTAAAEQPAAANPGEWEDIPVGKQDALHTVLAGYLGGSPQFSVYRGNSMYGLEWKTLLIDAGWSFDHYVDLQPDAVPHGITIKSNDDNEGNARLLQAAFQAIGIEPDFVADEDATTIMLIVGKR